MSNNDLKPTETPAESAAMTQNVEQKTLTKDEIQKAVDEYTRLSNELKNPMLDNATREAKRKRQDEIHNLFKNSTQGLNALSDAIKASNKPSKDTSEKSEPIQVASSDETRKVPEKDQKLQQTFEEFRDEASSALNEKLFSNGKANIQSFKEAMQMAKDLSALKLPKEIENIEKNEQRELQKRMPAVRGIVGAAFVDVLLKNNYTFVLNSNGTITLGYIQGRSTSDLLDANQLNDLINGPEGGKPFQELLHAGLLFHSGDLTKYAQLHSDANGMITDPTKTTYRDFVTYLNNLAGKSNDSQAALVLRSMGKKLDDKQFAEYLAATKYVPELTQNARAIEQAMQ